MHIFSEWIQDVAAAHTFSKNAERMNHMFCVEDNSVKICAMFSGEIIETAEDRTFTYEGEIIKFICFRDGKLELTSYPDEADIFLQSQSDTIIELAKKQTGIDTWYLTEHETVLVLKLFRTKEDEYGFDIT